MECERDFATRMYLSQHNKYKVKVEATHDRGERLYFPRRCVCCGAPEWEGYLGAEYSYLNIPSRTTLIWNFPCCASCIKHVKLDTTYRTYIVGALIFLIPLNIAAFYYSSESIGNLIWGIVLTSVNIFLGILYFYLPRKAKTMITERCSNVEAAVQYLGGDRDGHIFIFANENYAHDFANLNGAKQE